MGDEVLTERELDIMRVLWRLGPATAAEVRRELPDELAYTTVITMLRILEQKGHVAHTEEGRAHRFHPLVEQETAEQNAVSALVDRVFEGSAELLLVRLLKRREMANEEVERMRRLIDERLDRDEG